MSLALRIENGEIGGSRHRHRLDLPAERAAIGLHRVLVSSPIRAGTAPASRSGVWLLAQCRRGTCAPAGGELLTALFLLGEILPVSCFWCAHARARRSSGGDSKETRRLLTALARPFPKSQIPTDVYASAIGLCKDLSDCEDKLLRLPYSWMIARQALSCLRGRRDGRLKMVVRKLKAAISNGVLAYSRCNAVTSTRSLRDIIPPAGGFRSAVDEERADTLAFFGPM